MSHDPMVTGDHVVGGYAGGMQLIDRAPTRSPDAFMKQVGALQKSQWPAEMLLQASGEVFLALAEILCDRPSAEHRRREGKHLVQFHRTYATPRTGITKDGDADLSCQQARLRWLCA